MTDTLPTAIAFTLQPIYVGVRKPKRWAYPPTLNARLHWRARHVISTRWKEATWAAIRSGKLTPMMERATVTITRRGIRPVDQDNLVTGVKPILDGIVMAGLLPDDNLRHVQLVVLDEKVSHKEDECVVVHIVELRQDSVAIS